jgi:hypothetical protein
MTDAPADPILNFIHRPAIFLQAEEIDAQFSVVSPNPLYGFGYSRSRIADVVNRMRLAAAPSV